MIGHCLCSGSGLARLLTHLGLTFRKNSVWSKCFCCDVISNLWYRTNYNNYSIYWPRHAETCLRDLCGQRRTRSACASTQTDQGLHCPLIEPLHSTICINGEQRSGWYFAHAQDDLNLRIAHARRHFSLAGLYNMFCEMNPFETKEYTKEMITIDRVLY